MEDPAGHATGGQQHGLGFQADPDPAAVPSLSSDLTLVRSDLQDSIFSFIKWRDNRAPSLFRVTVRINYDSMHSMHG